MRISKKKLDLLVRSIYNECYVNSTPSITFDELYDKAEINEEGLKVIPFRDYILEYSKFEEIYDRLTKEYKLPKREKTQLRVGLMLGALPKFKNVFHE